MPLSLSISGRLIPIRQQARFGPVRSKVRDDFLFVQFEAYRKWKCYTSYVCIHMPTLVTSAQLPGGSLTLMENELHPKCKMEIETRSVGGPNRSIYEEIYSIPASLPTHPRYCVTVERRLGRYQGNFWDSFEVEIDLSIPGPIKGLSGVRQWSSVAPPGTCSYQCSDDDLLLTFPSVHGIIPCAPLSIRFLRVGTSDDWRAVKVRGMDKMRLSGLHVDRHAGYIIAWVEGRSRWARECSFIWWIDESEPDDLISRWTRRLLRGL